MTRSTNKWADAYKDSRWQKKRLEIMERDGWKCKDCGRGEHDGITLNVHHSFYVLGVKPWEYRSDSLGTYCEGCHKKRHQIQRAIQHVLADRNKTVGFGVFCMALFFSDSLDAIGRFNEELLSEENEDETRELCHELDNKISSFIISLLAEQYMKPEGVLQ